VSATCGTCRHWDEFTPEAPADERFPPDAEGICYGAPPTALAEDGVLCPAWPPTNREMSCGAWSPRVEPQPDPAPQEERE
jgi:hypothetical protein